MLIQWASIIRGFLICVFNQSKFNLQLDEPAEPIAMEGQLYYIILYKGLELLGFRFPQRSGNKSQVDIEKKLCFFWKEREKERS